MKSIARLNSLTSLNVVGKNAQVYLQGQLTADIKRVDASRMVRSALCCLKGRIIALFDVLPTAEGYSLILPQNVMMLAHEALKKSAMFSRVELKPDDAYVYFGLLSKDEPLLPPMGFCETDWGCMYQPMPGFYICKVQSSHLAAFERDHSEDLTLDEEAFFANALLDGYCHITGEESGLFLPHRLNLHLQEVISFDKGCYRGQEIIARTHYRATPKHELYIAKTDPKNLEALKAADPLLSNDGKPLGEYIESYRLNPSEAVFAASVYIEREHNPFP